MNLSNIAQELERIDPDFYERTDTRRNALKDFAGLGSKLALSALPLMLGSLLNKAYGRVSGRMRDVLEFALQLEQLEYSFYETALSKPDLIPKQSKIDVIRDHERAHVSFLEQMLRRAGGTVPFGQRYDFTAGGKFPAVFSDYTQFLAVAQALEDTGVAAYKGQAHKLKHNNELLESALRIHSMEARHAAHIRFIEMKLRYKNVKPWIVGDDCTKGQATARIYKKEDRHRQVLININHIGGHREIGDSATASFDEPLTEGQVRKVVEHFILES